MNSRGQVITNPWGIEAGYRDALGQWRETPAEVETALIRTMRGDPGGPSPSAVATHIQEYRGRPLQLAPGSEVTLEDGTTLGNVRRLPRDLPIGYHRIHPATGDGPRYCLLQQLDWPGAGGLGRP